MVEVSMQQMIIFTSGHSFIVFGTSIAHRRANAHSLCTSFIVPPSRPSSMFSQPFFWSRPASSCLQLACLSYAHSHHPSAWKPVNIFRAP